MDNFILWLYDFSLNVDFYKLCRTLTIGLGVLGVISILVSAIVYGYPRIKKGLLFLWLILGVALYYIATLNYKLGGKYFESLGACLKPVLLTFGAIIGLYAGFYLILLLFSLVRRRNIGEVTASLCNKLAFVEELPILSRGKEPLKVKTTKLCVKRPRLDDRVNFFKLEEYIKLLKSKPTPPSELAEIEFCERVIKHLKNTLLNEKTRTELNEAMQTLIKIGAKFEV